MVKTAILAGKWSFARSLFIVFLAASCSTSKDQNKAHWQKLTGRNTSEPIYKVKVPENWTKKEPNSVEELNDTTKPICEYFIRDDNGNIRVTLHTFPIQSLEQQISPWSQVERWQKQFTSIDAGSLKIEKISQNGFGGLFFEASGQIAGSEDTVLAWSMILDPHIYNFLQKSTFCSDYTIKVVGQTASIQKHYTEICNFAESFQLIVAIPFQR